jgi:hypothetical protein
MTSKQIPVYLEIGKKRTFAGALDWPGWCRSGPDEESALQALVDYGARYAHALSTTGKKREFGFHTPADVSSFVVVERIKGDATTDFGAPGHAPKRDSKPVDDAEFARLQAILKACWRAFDRAVKSATGSELRKGPRGGGRELEAVVQHVLGADGGYLSSLGWKVAQDETADLNDELKRTRKAILEGLKAAAHGEIPRRGPRGGLRWPLRYFVRRSAWHVLDHAWEIEDRIERRFGLEQMAGGESARAANPLREGFFEEIDRAKNSQWNDKIHLALLF